MNRTPAAEMTQYAFKQTQKALREAQAKYVVARREALALPKAASIITREEAIGRAIEARYWVQTYRRRLQACVALPPGANYSSGAQARLRSRGRLA